MGKFYSTVVKNLLLFPFTRVVGYEIGRHFRFMQKSQWWTTEKLQAYQAGKLKELLSIASLNVPYYQQFFGNEECVRLSAFPIIDKQTIKPRLDEFKNSGYRNRLIKKSSSGSTGMPFQYYVDDIWKGSKIASWFRALEWTGYHIGERYINITGFPHGYFKNYPLLFALEKKFLGLTNISPFDLHNDTFPGIITRIRETNVQLIRGYASSIFEIANFLLRSNDALHVKAVITTGETLFPEQRKAIENAFRCKVFDEYGADAGLIANQCEYGKYHTNSENVVVEIVDDQMLPCAPGVTGEIVVTALNLLGFPLIRYNTHDTGSFSHESCRCGRGLQVLNNVEGRITDRIVLGNGKILTVHMFTGLFMPMEEVRQFQIRQQQPLRLAFDIVLQKDLSADARATLDEKISSIIGPGIEYQVLVKEHLDLNHSNAKRKFFIKEF